MKALAAKPTPKTADGHPDLNGHWVPPETGMRVSYGKIVGNEHQLIFGIPATGDAQTDAAVTEELNKKKDARTQKMLETGPQYKPEFKDKVIMMGKDPNHYDPTVYSCLPPGVPRMGAPRAILEAPGEMVLLYGPDPYSSYRVVPMNKPHRKVDEDFDANPMGDSVGHWEGDTLVIDTTGFDDTTWFGAAGYFHTDAMHVIEKFTRKGDTLEYSATVEDPNVLTKPFDLTPQVLRRRTATSCTTRMWPATSLVTTIFVNMRITNITSLTDITCAVHRWQSQPMHRKHDDWRNGAAPAVDGEVILDRRRCQGKVKTPIT